MSDTSPIKLMYLERQRAQLGDRLEQAISRVLAHGSFILGPEVAALEAELAALTGARHAVTCGNGTDALELALQASSVGVGDAVFVPAFTFVATAEAASTVGATPVFVDVDADSFNLSPASLEAAVEDVGKHGLRPAAVIAVDLFGLPADYRALNDIARNHRMALVADAAQSFGALVNGQRVGTLADVTTTSFFPSKPLGCLGDGGAVLCNDDDLAAAVRSLRIHGMGSSKYDNVRVGMNSRLDTLQAAVLLEKLKIFEEELQRRDAVASRYAAALQNVVMVPAVPADVRSTWALYTIRSRERNRLREHLGRHGIGCAVYYERPLHRQPAYRDCPVSPTGLATSEALSGEVLSLPMDPYLEPDEIDRVCAAVRSVHTPEPSADG